MNLPEHRPALSVDCVVFGIDAAALQVLLIRRLLPPHKEQWALPGGFVHLNESVDDAARRELREEAGLDHVFLEQLYTFGDTDRDPRGRVVTVAYFALVQMSKHPVKASTDASDANWFPAAHLPPLAFDHARILDTARERLRGKVRYQPIAFELLPKRFTLTQLQTLYEVILERPLDKRNFRKKVLDLSLLQDTGTLEEGAPHRPARLYAFDRKKYERLAQNSFHFEL